MVRFIGLLLCASALWSPALAQRTDLERLAIPLPAGFRRPVVAVHPLVDQRGFFGEAPADLFWHEFNVALAGYANLNVKDPDAVRAERAATSTYKRQVASARALAQEGLVHYRNVRLAEASRTLNQALREFRTSRHAEIDPQEVGRVALAFAQTLLEAGDPDAPEAFERALGVDPTLQLREGFDSPDAVAGLAAARVKLSAAPPVPAAFNARPKRRDSVTRIYGRMLSDRVEIAIHSAGAIRFESQSLSAPDAPQRLAARVWACVPFGRAPGRAPLRNRGALDVGFTGFSFLESPIGRFGNVGVGSNFSWLLAERLTLDVRLSLTVSGRDAEQDLRADIPAVRFAIAPGGVWGGDRWRGTINLGIEGAYLGEVVVTTIPACKHFDPNDGIPPAICDFDRDIDTTPGAFVAGPVLTFGGSLRLVDQIYVMARAHAAAWFFETAESGFGVPVGLEVALGYRLF